MRFLPSSNCTSPHMHFKGTGLLTHACRITSASRSASTLALYSSSPPGLPCCYPSSWAAAHSRRTGRYTPILGVSTSLVSLCSSKPGLTHTLTDFCQPAISRIDIIVTVVLNVLTDIYLMSIPIPMLWTSSLRPLKKAGLMLLFSGGIFVTAAAILRCVLIIDVRTPPPPPPPLGTHTNTTPSLINPPPHRTPSTARKKPAPGPCARPSSQSSPPTSP